MINQERGGCFWSRWGSRLPRKQGSVVKIRRCLEAQPGRRAAKRHIYHPLAVGHVARKAGEGRRRALLGFWVIKHHQRESLEVEGEVGESSGKLPFVCRSFSSHFRPVWCSQDGEDLKGKTPGSVGGGGLGCFGFIWTPLWKTMN